MNLDDDFLRPKNGASSFDERSASLKKMSEKNKPHNGEMKMVEINKPLNAQSKTLRGPKKVLSKMLGGIFGAVEIFGKGVLKASGLESVHNPVGNLDTYLNGSRQLLEGKGRDIQKDIEGQSEAEKLQQIQTLLSGLSSSEDFSDHWKLWSYSFDDRLMEKMFVQSVFTPEEQKDEEGLFKKQNRDVFFDRVFTPVTRANTDKISMNKDPSHYNLLQENKLFLEKLQKIDKEYGHESAANLLLDPRVPFSLMFGFLLLGLKKKSIFIEDMNDLSETVKQMVVKIEEMKEQLLDSDPKEIRDNILKFSLKMSYVPINILIFLQSVKVWDDIKNINISDIFNK